MLYFNKDWDPGWGGNISVHNVPKTADSKTLEEQFAPLNGRMVMFETSKVSYHAFDRINAPENRGRQSFGIYYYTKVIESDKPSRNTTMYWGDGLPESVRPDAELSKDSYSLIKQMLHERDMRINDLYVRLNNREEQLQNLGKRNTNTQNKDTGARIGTM